MNANWFRSNWLPKVWTQACCAIRRRSSIWGLRRRFLGQRNRPYSAVTTCYSHASKTYLQSVITSTRAVADRITFIHIPHYQEWSVDPTHNFMSSASIWDLFCSRVNFVKSGFKNSVVDLGAHVAELHSYAFQVPQVSRCIWCVQQMFWGMIYIYIYIQTYI